MPTELSGSGCSLFFDNFINERKFRRVYDTEEVPNMEHLCDNALENYKHHRRPVESQRAMIK